MKVIFLLLPLLLIALVARAEDQRYTLNDPPRPIARPKALCAPDAVTCPLDGLQPGNIEGIITEALHAGGKGEIDKGTYYLLHLVRYDQASLDKNSIVVEASKWYVYFKNWKSRGFWDQFQDLRLDQHFRETRLFGGQKVCLVYLHYVNAGNSLASRQLSITYQVTAVKKLPDLVENLKLAAGVIFAAAGKGEAPPAIVGLKEMVFDHHPADITVSGSVGLVAEQGEIKAHLAEKKVQLVDLQGTLADLKEQRVIVRQQEAASKITPAQARDELSKLDLQEAALAKRQAAAEKSVAETEKKLTEVDKQPTDLGKQTFDNEKKYWYDVSFVFPVRSFDELKYDSGIVTGRKVENQNLYFAVNLFPVPVDTKKLQWRVVPGLLYGMGIRGKPLGRQLVGVSLGSNYVQPFIGLTFDRVQKPPQAGALGTEFRWVRRISYGINFQVRTLVNILKPSK